MARKPAKTDPGKRNTKAGRTARADLPVLGLGDLTPDPNNLREHNPRNVGMIEDALKRHGAGRSIVIDEHGTVLAGNATLEAALAAGFEHVLVVPADGKTLVAVQRSGLTDSQKLDLAVADNRTAELATGWKAEPLKVALAELAAPGRFFYPEELAALDPPPARDEIVDDGEAKGGGGSEPKTVTCPKCAAVFAPGEA